MPDSSKWPSAPVDQAAVAQALQPFGESLMLPPAAYTDPAVFAWEQRHFFDACWTCVGFSADLARPGDQRAEPVGTGSVLLTRDDDGGLHAFANTCRHRGHELLERGATARANSVICPYHAWTYTLSGELSFAPALSRQQEFDGSAWGLVELPAGEWHGLIFVDSSGGRAGALADFLASLDELVTPYEPERLVIAGRHTYDSASNWKILSENYHECYHCPVIHPELSRVSPPKSADNYPPQPTWAGGWMQLGDGMDTMSLDGASPGVPLRGLDDSARRTISYVNIFPNVLLSLHPDYVMTHRLIPVTVDRTIIECVWAFPPEALERPGFDPRYAIEFWDITNRQDWTACESVQRGLASPHARPGPLSPEEDGVYQFEVLVARGYQGQPIQAPARAR
jgi:Rieske 2Fe-2S family protein